MRIRYVILIGLVSMLYVLAGYLVLGVIPVALTRTQDFSTVSDPATKARLILDSRNSIRSGAVSLLAGSILGVAGLVAVLTYVGVRRDASGAQRKSQDDLFGDALASAAQDKAPLAIGGISLLTELALARPDLHPAVTSTMFTLAREHLRRTGAIEPTLGERSVDDLSDREPIAAAALKAIGTLPIDTGAVRTGDILNRRLDGCDLRRVRLADARLELIDFTRSYFWDSRFVDCVFVKCIFPGADWLGAELTRVEFIECDLTNTNLVEARGRAVVIRRSDIDASLRLPDWLQMA